MLLISYSCPRNIVGKYRVNQDALKTISRTKTVPEQIADQLAAKIVEGEYRGGDPLREQELALSYGVSRGPIRDAIRELEKRGMVEIFPRRGAYVINLTVNAVADAFNIRATLMGLAVRYLTRNQDSDALEHLEERLKELEQLSMQHNVDPDKFVSAIWRLTAIISLQCGNGHLTRMLRDQLKHSLWGVLWGNEPLDYTTHKRRKEVTHDYRELFKAIKDGRDEEAELLQRHILFSSRDQAVAVFERLRHQKVESSRMLRDQGGRGRDPQHPPTLADDR